MSIAYITNLTTYNKKRTFFFVIIVNIFAKDSSTVEQNIFNIFSVKLIELKSFFLKESIPFCLRTIRTFYISIRYSLFSRILLPFPKSNYFNSVILHIFLIVSNTIFVYVNISVRINFNNFSIAIKQKM